MGLSRNKVAVSEGAAGSPPFYGEPKEEKLSFTSLQYSTRKQTKAAFNHGKQQTGVNESIVVVRFSRPERESLIPE